MQNTQPLRSLDSLDAAPSLAVQQALAQEKPFWTIWSIGGLILAIAVLIYSGLVGRGRVTRDAAKPDVFHVDRGVWRARFLGLLSSHH